MRSDWWKFNECMMLGTRSPVRYIRRGEEGVRAGDLRPSENQATHDYVKCINSQYGLLTWSEGICDMFVLEGVSARANHERKIPQIPEGQVNKCLFFSW